MSQLDLARELRAARPAAPSELRARVAALSPTPGRRPLRTSRWVLVAVGAAVVATTGGALARGLTSTTNDGASSAAAAASTVSLTHSANRQRKEPYTWSGALAQDSARRAPLEAPATLPSRGPRLQQYRTHLTVKVRGTAELARATSAAMRITRSLGGYVVSAHYGTPRDGHGVSTLRVRVPRTRIQGAIARLSALGTIIGQQISIRDVQSRVDRNRREIADLRRYVGLLRAALRKPGLPEDQRVALQMQLSRATRALGSRVAGNSRELREARLATVTLSLTTQRPEVVERDEPGRIESLFRSAGRILLLELAYGLYALIVAGPLLVVFALAVLAARVLRRRQDERLLDSA